MGIIVARYQHSTYVYPHISVKVYNVFQLSYVIIFNVFFYCPLPNVEKGEENDRNAYVQTARGYAQRGLCPSLFGQKVSVKGYSNSITVYSIS